jgi:hypothetical protein
MAPIPTNQILKLREQKKEELRKLNDECLSRLYETIDTFVLSPANNPQTDGTKVFWNVPISEEFYHAFMNPNDPYAIFPKEDYGKKGWSIFHPTMNHRWGRDNPDCVLELGYVVDKV